MPNQKFEKIYCEVNRFLNSSGLIEDYSNHLTRGSPIGNVVRTYSILKDANLLPKPIKKVVKSDKLSAKFRGEGNEAFKKKEDIMALKHYTRAVASAPGGKELALAYANRSAATYSLGEYKHCMRDIDRAMQNNYPDKLKYKLLERKGKCLIALSKPIEATRVLSDALELLPKSELDLVKKNEIKRNLENSLTKCSAENKELMNEVQEDGVCNLPELSHPPSDYIQVASNAVDICFTKGMGRHILASTDLYPGDVIAVEKPFASVLLPGMYNFFCFLCKKRCHSLLPCLHCTEVLFCSEKCRADGWEQSHCIECNLLPTLISIGCENMELLAVKILLLASGAGKKCSEIIREEKRNDSYNNPREKGFIDGKYLSDNYESTYNLEMNEQVRSVDDICRRLVMATCILFALEECTDYFKYAEKSCTDAPYFHLHYLKGLDGDTSFLKGIVGAYLFRYLLSVPCNAHEVSEMRLKPTGTDYDYGSVEIGGAIYPFLSLINHSCDPNVVRHNYCGDLVALIAIQVIKQGDQIFDNYSYHHAIHTKEERQSHLLSQYYFVCKCDACLYDWPPYVNLPDKNPVYYDNVNKEEIEKSSTKFKDVLKEICSGKIEGQLPFLYKHLTLLHNSISRPWKEYNQCQEAIKQCLSKLANHYEYKTLNVDN